MKQATVILLGILGLLPLAARAHPAHLTVATAKVSADGCYEVTLRFDALAFALNETPARVEDVPMNELLDGPRAELGRLMGQSRMRFARGVQIRAGNREVPIARLDFPTGDDVQRWTARAGSSRLPVLLEARFTGKLPAHAESLVLRFPEIIGDVIVTLESPGAEPVVALVVAGVVSEPFRVGLARVSAVRR